MEKYLNTLFRKEVIDFSLGEHIFHVSFGFLLNYIFLTSFQYIFKLYFTVII